MLFAVLLSRVCSPNLYTSQKVHYNPQVLSQGELLSILVDAESSLPSSMAEMVFPGRTLTFPIVLDDRWNRDALDRYMRSARDKAVYLPSNIEYLARNNGLRDGAEALDLLVKTPWVRFLARTCDSLCQYLCSLCLVLGFISPVPSSCR